MLPNALFRGRNLNVSNIFQAGEGSSSSAIDCEYAQAVTLSLARVPLLVEVCGLCPREAVCVLKKSGAMLRECVGLFD